MNTLVRPFTLVCFLLSASNALAAGTLTLTAQYGGNTQTLNIYEVTDGYRGTLTTNDAQENVQVDYTAGQIVITVGAETYSLDVTRSTSQVTYTGPLAQGRQALLFGTYKSNRSTWLYDGTVGVYDDLTGKGRTDSLDMSYGKYKLTLDSTGSGSCSGAIRVGGTTTTTFSCQTTDTLLDAFFTNPDHVVLWLVNLYFK
jgi:hypothetical protein